MNVPVTETELTSYGRPKGDGEGPFGVKCGQAQTGQVRLKAQKLYCNPLLFLLSCHVMTCRFCRHIFLFDVIVIVCKRRGDNYEMKEVIDLNLSRSPITPLLKRTAERSVRNTVNRNVCRFRKLQPNIKQSYFFLIILESAIHHIVHSGGFKEVWLAQFSVSVE